MKARQPRLRAVSAALLLAAVASSCAGGSSDAHQAKGPGSPTVQSEQSAPSPAQGALSGPDAATCNSIEGILSHIRVDTARWSPTTHPFDATIAERLANQTKFMNEEALNADYPVRRAVAATADAFGEVSDAIIARSHAQLNQAVDHSRSAYSALKKVCRFED